MATIFEFNQGQERITHTMMLDFTAILIGYGFEREEAREIAAKAVQVAREHVEANPGVLRRNRFGV
jgi:hypothetical protein